MHACSLLGVRQMHVELSAFEENPRGSSSLRSCGDARRASSDGFPGVGRRGLKKMGDQGLPQAASARRAIGPEPTCFGRSSRCL